MTRILKKRSKKAGLPPGSLVHIGNHTKHPIQITVTDFDGKKLTIKYNATLKECLAFLETPEITWIHISGINDPEMIATIGRRLRLHPLLLEDILNAGQRSKLDDYKDTLFLICRFLRYDIEKHEVEDEQISLILGNNYLISFQESEANIFEPVWERLRNPKSRIREMGPDYLCYGLVDCIVDHYFVILEHIDEDLETLEQELVNRPDPSTLRKIQHIKREITLLRKAVWPMREVISGLQRKETPLLSDSTKLYLHDVYDHTIQAIDTIESFRDISSGMLDIYLSNISQRLNEIMKVLTVLATIFVPLTFIASFYGMNFQYMPETHWKYGYVYVLTLMGLITSVMLVFFRRNKWI
jgi:magnesium transporter